MPILIAPVRPRDSASVPELFICLAIEAEDHLAIADQDRPADQIRLLHHQIDRFLLRLRQRPLLEHRAARADEIEEVLLVDVSLEERTIGRIGVDVDLRGFDVMLLQKTSGIAAGRSRRLPVKSDTRHEWDCTLPSGWAAERL